MTAEEYKAPESVGKMQQGALVVGVLGLAASVAGYFLAPEQFYHSYLIAFMFVLGLSLGSLGLLMLQHLTGGQWGIVIRRPLEAATRTLPLVAVLFVPLIFGMHYLYYGWLDAPASGEGSLSDLQKHYLTHNLFLVRAAIYFAVWLGMMFLFNYMSRQQDLHRDDRKLRRRFKFWAGPGIIVYVVLMTFAAIDWVMSLTPKWASTIYGFLFVAGQAISAMALMITIVVLLARTEAFSRLIKTKHLHDLGKLLFAFVLLWAYFDFSQLLIIWSGNLPEEITFYRARLFGGWGAVAVIVLIFHFFVPFFILLSSNVKRSTRLLPRVAIWLMIMRTVDLYWMTRPEMRLNGAPVGPLPSWLDFAALAGLAGVWLWFFAGQLKQQPLLPLGEPKLAEAIGQNEH